MKLLAQQDNIFGPVSTPPGVADYGGLREGGLVGFLNNILKFLIIIAGVYALLNLIIAGYQFMSAGGDQKQIESAWARIWQSLIGLLIVAGSFVLAAVFGQIVFGDPFAILRPKVFGPTTP